jgi:tRNA A-37 threonylcarbamoyl transferase component Bud32
MSTEPGPQPRRLDEVRAADFARPDLMVWHDGNVYRTTGDHLGHGGMGTVHGMERLLADGNVEPVVAKTFHPEYLYQLRTDDVTRRDHEEMLRLLAQIAAIGHPNLLPTYVSAPIADNHLIVTPRGSETLLAGVVRGAITPRRRIELLIQAVRGLSALHEARVLHRDFTLRNILLAEGMGTACLFDFDLALSLDGAVGMTYRERYNGRVFGSPGYSVPPEVLDAALLESPISERLDVYAIGGALWGLFTDQLPHGPTEDMWGLLFRIAEGVVHGGASLITYPESVPLPVRPIIERCLERDPGHRYPTARDALSDLEACAGQLADRRVTRVYDATIRYDQTDREARMRSVVGGRHDLSITQAQIEGVDDALGRYGYVIQRSLGRVKGHAIFLVVPAPQLLAAGQFPDSNTYPKIVTAIDLSQAADPPAVVDQWLGAYLPVLRSVRQGLLTSLYRGVHDEPSGHLFLFSEYVDDPRFGQDLEGHELTLPEALGLGFLVARQVGRLHDHGLAHNNVRASALLLKGVRDTQRVHPAMVGLVDPSLDPAAMSADVRHVAALAFSWIRPSRVGAMEPRVRAHLEELRGRLSATAFDESVEPPPIDNLVKVLAEGLAWLDANFAILWRHGGDLDAYTLLLICHPLYARLWG